MFILKTGHQPGVYVPLRALFLVKAIVSHNLSCFQPPILPDVLYEGDTSNYNHSVSVSKTGIISFVMLLLACQLFFPIHRELERMLV